MERPHGSRDNAAVAFNTAANGDNGGMSGIARGQLLGVRHHNLYGPSRLARQQIGNRQIDAVAFAAELPADVDGIDANRLLGNGDGVSQLSAHAERILGRDPYLDPSARLDRQYARMRLDVTLVPGRNVERVLKNEICLKKPSLDVALAPGQPGKSVMDV